MDEHDVWLPPSLFYTLSRLVCARFANATDVVELTTVEAFRLRKALEESNGVQGPEFVELAGDRGYRIGLNKHEIAIDVTFSRAINGHMIPSEIYDAIKANVAKWNGGNGGLHRK